MPLFCQRFLSVASRCFCGSENSRQNSWKVTKTQHGVHLDPCAGVLLCLKLMISSYHTVQVLEQIPGADHRGIRVCTNGKNRRQKIGRTGCGKGSQLLLNLVLITDHCHVCRSLDTLNIQKTAVVDELAIAVKVLRSNLTSLGFIVRDG